MTDGEVRRLYMENRYTLRVNADDSCIFLKKDQKSGHCSVYQARPDQCRSFPHGKSCPYLTRKDLYALDPERLQEVNDSK